MSNSVTYKQLKAIAKERSLDKYGTLILANIMIFAIQIFISGITTVSTSGSIMIFIINQIITLIVNILLGVLVSGKAYLYLNLVYSQTISASDIFFGLKQQPQKAVIIQALFVLVDFLVSLPASLILFFSRQSSVINVYLSAVIFLILGIVVYIYISLTYSQAFFLLHDFPDRSAKELLATSRRLMKGNRLRLLGLYLSFIPLYLFGVITLFIPLLWVSVYRYATITVFYQNLISSKANHNATCDQTSMNT
jgi:uncharacterized membrane protein